MGETLIMKDTLEFTERELDRIIEMAWEDRTPFEAIEFQFKIPEKSIIQKIPFLQVLFL